HYLQGATQAAGPLPLTVTLSLPIRRYRVLKDKVWCLGLVHPGNWRRSERPGQLIRITARSITFTDRRRQEEWRDHASGNPADHTALSRPRGGVQRGQAGLDPLRPGIILEAAALRRQERPVGRPG